MRIYVIYLYQGAGFPDKNVQNREPRSRNALFYLLAKATFFAGVRPPAVFVIRKPPAVPGVQKSFSVEQKPPTW